MRHGAELHSAAMAAGAAAGPSLQCVGGVMKRSTRGARRTEEEEEVDEESRAEAGEEGGERGEEEEEAEEEEEEEAEETHELKEDQQRLWKVKETDGSLAPGDGTAEGRAESNHETAGQGQRV